MRVDLRGSGRGIGGGVGTNSSQRLGLILLFFVLLAKAAFSWQVDGPGRVVLAPVVSVFSYVLGLLFTVLGRHLLPSFILFLIHLVGRILLVFLLAPFLFLLVDKLAKLLIELQLTL